MTGSTFKYSIFPAIGVARVGNAPEDYYVAPEEYRGLPILPNGERREFTQKDLRDKHNLLRRQAQRFKIYCNETGEEITLASSGVDAITWTVHLANKKASWYTFLTKTGEDGYPPGHPLRNATVTEVKARQALNIDAGPRTVAGANAHAAFTAATAPKNYPVSFPPANLNPKASAANPTGSDITTLGDLVTDAQGRLLVLGGHGHAGTTKEDTALPAYANNDEWWDDNSDGPVTATITLKDGDVVTVESAWVLVAPPAYAPEIPNLVTLYDTIFDTAVRKLGAAPEMYAEGFWKQGANGYHPSFETDIKPIFERGEAYRWVTAIPPRPHSFDYQKLGDPDPRFNAYRHYFLSALRPPGGENVLVDTKTGVTMMPYLAGDDAIGAQEADSPSVVTSRYLRLTDTQYYMLEQWANGHFVSGAVPAGHPGEALTRAVLDNCVGGAFSPGIEMTWISRNPAIYERPFRFRTRAPLNPTEPLSLGFDPLAGMEPGDITRYMAVPWQADFNQCSSQPIYGRVLWWWPAQRPEYVHLEQLRPNEERQVAWVGTDYDQNAGNYILFAANTEMVEKWWQLGFVYGKGTPPTRYELVEAILHPVPGGNDTSKPQS